jgi:hypothetical protein
MRPIVPEGHVENSPGWSEAESWEDTFIEYIRRVEAERISLGVSMAFMRLPCYYTPAGSPRNIFQNSRKPLSRTTWK